MGEALRWGGSAWVDDAGLFIYLRLSGREHSDLSQTLTHHDWTRPMCHDQPRVSFGRNGYGVRRSHRPADGGWDQEVKRVFSFSFTDD